jgi:hypothetical protein
MLYCDMLLQRPTLLPRQLLAGGHDHFHTMSSISKITAAPSSDALMSSRYGFRP